MPHGSYSLPAAAAAPRIAYVVAAPAVSTWGNLIAGRGQQRYDRGGRGGRDEVLGGPLLPARQKPDELADGADGGDFEHWLATPGRVVIRDVTRKAES